MTRLALDRSFRIARHRSSYPADWCIEDDEVVLQTVEHQLEEVRLQSVFLAWKARTGRKELLVGCELAFRWDELHPRVGVDPDVYIVEEPPRGADGNIRRVRTWEKDNMPPLLAIEIASSSRPQKDYTYSPEKHDLLGTNELWVFDPELYGHSKTQPPVYLQMFQRETNDHLVRTYAGNGPVFSETLHAWVSVVDGELVISNDREGNDRWLTREEEALRRAEAERAEKEKALAEKEKALAEKEKALARIAELEALLAERK